MKNYIKLILLILVVLLIISASTFVIYTIASKSDNFTSEFDDNFDTDYYKKYIRFKYAPDTYYGTDYYKNHMRIKYGIGKY